MGAFYVRKGSESQRWIIYLQGGGACYTEKSCSKRDDYRKSSKDYPKTIGQKAGLLNPSCSTNPYWCNANQVFVPYCTSDFYAGDRGASDETWGLHFRGWRVVDAIIDTLIKKHGLDKDSKEILWSGCSAGGKGALYNMDRVQKRLPHMKALLDSNWWVKYPSMKEGIRDFETMLKASYSLWNAQMNKQCVKDYKDKPWLCMFPYHNEKYVKTTHLNQVFQYDAIQFNKNTANEFKKPTSDAKNYGEKLRKAIAKSFDDVNPDNSSMFSPACYKHCSTAENIMFHTTVNGETLSETLIKWFKGKLPKSKRMNIDKCKGRNCSDQCSKITINKYNPMKPPYDSEKSEEKSENEPEEKSDKESEEKSDKKPIQIKVLKSKHGRRSRTQGISVIINV